MKDDFFSFLSMEAKVKNRRVFWSLFVNYIHPFIYLLLFHTICFNPAALPVELIHVYRFLSYFQWTSQKYSILTQNSLSETHKLTVFSHDRHVEINSALWPFTHRICHISLRIFTERNMNAVGIFMKRLWLKEELRNEK